jgi:TetR/AcrR family transcriptional regulator, cholesterol catabolism regulator
VFHLFPLPRAGDSTHSIPLFTKAMSHDEPTDEDKAIARVIGDVWLSNLVAWVTRRASATDVTTRLELTVRLLLR